MNEAYQVATGEHALADDEVFDPKAVADESSKAADAEMAAMKETLVGWVIVRG